MHVAVCLFFMLFFYGICAFAMLFGGGYSRVKELYKSITVVQKAVLLAILAAAGVFILYWMKQNHFIYYWDYGAYWGYSIDRMNYMFSHSFTDVVKSLFESINNDDYNILIPTIVALPLKTLGYTFSRYVFINCLMFLFPTFLVQGMLAVKLLRHSAMKPGWVFVMAVFLAVCFPGNYYAAFQGYADIAFLLPMSIVMYLFIGFDFGKGFISRDVSIALLLVLMWLLRRYAVYFIVGFVAALLVQALRYILKDEKNSLKQKIKTTVFHFAVIGGVSLGILLVFFRKFFIRALLTDFGSMYTAYDAPLTNKIAALVSAYGYISGIVIVITGILCIWNRKHIGMYLSLLVMGTAETVIFWQTQSMSVQHKMILNLPVFMLCIMVLDFWDMEAVRKRKAGITALVEQTVTAACVFLLVFNFAKAYIPVVSATGTDSFFSARYYPFQRGDMEELNHLVNRLNELTDNTDDYIYVAASGTVLNYDILRKIYMPNSNDAVPHMFQTYDVDMRDGFPAAFLQAEYVVTTDPVQLHLLTGQEVVSYLASNVQDSNSYIGCHYEYMEQVELDYGVQAKIYRKKSEFSEDDLQQLRDYYSGLYPGNESIFADRIKL